MALVYPRFLAGGTNGQALVKRAGVPTWDAVAATEVTGYGDFVGGGKTHRISSDGSGYFQMEDVTDAKVFFQYDHALNKAKIGANLGLGFDNVGSIERLVNDGQLRIMGGLAGSGADIWLYGSAHATAPNEMRLDGSPITLRDSTGTTPAAIFDGTKLQLGTNTATLCRNRQDSALRLAGGNADGDGAGLSLYGPTHATLPYQAYLSAIKLTLREHDYSPTFATFDATLGIVFPLDLTIQDKVLKLLNTTPNPDTSWDMWTGTDGVLHIKASGLAGDSLVGDPATDSIKYLGAKFRQVMRSASIEDWIEGFAAGGWHGKRGFLNDYDNDSFYWGLNSAIGGATKLRAFFDFGGGAFEVFRYSPVAAGTGEWRHFDKIRSDVGFNINGVDGASGGPFTSISSITVANGIVTAITGS